MATDKSDLYWFVGLYTAIPPLLVWALLFTISYLTEWKWPMHNLDLVLGGTGVLAYLSYIKVCKMAGIRAI